MPKKIFSVQVYMTNSPTTEIKKQTFVCIKTSFRGFHCWPNAPEPVSFLRQLHRHLFGVLVEVRVNHADRDVEFFTLQHDVDLVIVKQVTRVMKTEHSLSCEMIAEMIQRYLAEQGYDVACVEVSEDGENSARITFERA